MKRQCSKPCINCPFRNDIVPYQTTRDVLENVNVILSPDPKAHAICHFRAYQVGIGADGRTVIGGGILTTCAGFLVMRQKLGLPLPAHNQPVQDQSFVYGDIADFVLHAPCPDQSNDARSLAGLASRPKHVQERMILAWADQIKEENRRVEKEEAIPSACTVPATSQQTAQRTPDRDSKTSPTDV